MDLILHKNTDFDGAALYAKIEELNNTIKAKTLKYDLLGPLEDHYQTLEKFNTYPTELRQKVFNDFDIYAQILSTALNSLEVNFSDHQILWNVLKKLNLSFEDDLFETIDAGDIVEIYRNDNIQIYRNFRFHELCDYKLPELFTMPWDQLFYREPYFTKQMMNTSMSIFQSQDRTKKSLAHIQPHELRELRSDNKASWTMNLKSAYPLFNATDDFPEYVLCTSKVSQA